MGRVWPRHGHRGRPFNRIVRQHQSNVAQSPSSSFFVSRGVAIVGALVAVGGLLIVAFPGYSPQGVVEFFLGLPVVGLGAAILGASCLIDWDERPQAARILGMILFVGGVLAILVVLVRWKIVVG